ncbi:hypothetical protein OKW31_002723 [Paraburkholderia atlantica]|uniref:hypothetical protein n=1 Tax=Paraburkholderia atlantica TaxID=2654982 RepID=UPI003D2287F9
MAMPRSAGGKKNDTSLEDARIQHVIRRAVVAAVMFDPKGVSALLELPDVELGRLFKNHLWEAAAVVTVFNLDLPSISEQEENLRKRFKRISKLRTPQHEALTESAMVASPERYPLVLQGKVLRTEDFCQAAHITEKQLLKYVASGRIFSVDFGPEPYYPAFFLSSMIYRDDFAKVIRRLGDTPAWSKWDFFTTPIDSQEGSTPLQLLMVEEVETVLKAAAHFAAR